MDSTVRDPLPGPSLPSLGTRVFFGWKDFYVQDHPMLTPSQTIARTPALSMISYQ